MENIEEYNARLEKAETQLKQKLRDFYEYMPVYTDNNDRLNVTLLQIYDEWMNFLVKKSAKNNQDDLLNQWKTLLVTYSPNTLAELLIQLFNAKRNYQSWNQNGNYKQASAEEAKRISENLRIYNDDLVNRLLSSYSGAEKRIRKNIKEWKLLSDVSKSLVELLSLAKDEKPQDNSSQESSESEEPKTETDNNESAEKEEKTYWAGVQLEIEFPEETPEEPSPDDDPSPVIKPDYLHDPDVNQNDLYNDKDDDYQYSWQKWANK